MTGLAPGVYFLYVGAHSTVTGQWVQFAWSFTATAHPISGVETPASGASVGQPFALSGWAIDQAAATGTGVDYVDVWAYPNPGSGASAVYWGPTTLGGSRPAVGAQYGAQFTNSGFTLTVTGKAAGSYLMQVGIRSAVTGTWTIQTRQAYVDLPTVALLIDRQGTGTGGVSASGLTCPGGSGTQAVPCGASYTLQTVVTLVPQPDAGSSFGGWTGACSGLGACQLTMSQARFASAQFIKAPSTLAPSYYHVDAIGSVRAITDQSGTTVIRHDYFPFGEDTQPLTGDPMRFGGTELDSESGLNYMGARNYRNTWGRFLSPDPVGGTLTNPQRWNGYAYALNNPLRFIDPTGMMTRDTDPYRDEPGNPCSGGDDTCYDGSEYYCFVNPGCYAPGSYSPTLMEAAFDTQTRVDNFLNSQMAASGRASQAASTAPSAATPQAPPDGGRPLSPDEKEEVQKVFGPKVDVEKVGIKDGKYIGILGTNKRPITPNNTIHWPGCGSKPMCGDKATFMHEMTHVLQHQSGVNVRMRGFLLQTMSFLTFGRYDPYALKSYDPSRSFKSYNIEQQGTIVEGIVTGALVHKIDY